MKPQGYYNLLEAFAEEGCAVCRVLAASTERFILYLLADRVLDGTTLYQLRARRGLCNYHISILIQRKGIVLPLAIFYKAAMDELAEIMNQMSVPSGNHRLSDWLHRHNNSTLADRLEPTTLCLICANMQEEEAALLDILCEYVTSTPMRETYQASAGLCLPHLIQALRTGLDSGAAEVLIAKQKAVWNEGAAELEQFIAILNFSRRGEPMGHESGSLLRAIEWTGGLGGLFGLDTRHD